MNKKGGTRKKNTVEKDLNNLVKEHKKKINKIKRLEKSISVIQNKLDNYEIRLQKKSDEANKINLQFRQEEDKIEQKQNEIEEANNQLKNIEYMMKNLNMRFEVQNLKKFNINSKTKKNTKKSKFNTY